uniref:Kelch domain-containing protein 8B n=1 Tax=Knipowitschia caucasica TaxID=637954 RepID=A0AAV2M1G6_KNICA
MPVRVMSSLRWQPLPPLSERRVYCSACSDQRGASLLYVLGGCGEGGGASNAAMRLDVSAQRWNALPPMHAARAGAVAVAMEAGQVLVVGGVDHAQTPLATVETYRPDEGKWQVTAALEQAAMGVTAIENGDSRGTAD